MGELAQQAQTMPLPDFYEELIARTGYAVMLESKNTVEAVSYTHLAPGFFPGRRYEMGRICLYWKRYLAILGSAYYNRPCSRRRRRRILKNWGEVLET